MAQKLLYVSDKGILEPGYGNMFRFLKKTKLDQYIIKDIDQHKE